ncbi:hornerin-like [Iris pallida]|uniref:Hornerin-like n=1 Tax=Iris pallida TaxID=29817 RepID=A0AAX6FQM6_IRIPA|nr:hornerin-like [Iris pallida]
MRRPLQSVPGLAGDTRVARAANPIAFGKRPVEYVPSRPFRLVREREGTRTRATRCPRVTALRRLVWTGWALGARVCRACGCGGRGGARRRSAPGPGPERFTLRRSRRHDGRPRQRPSPRERPGGAGVDEDVLPG